MQHFVLLLFAKQCKFDTNIVGAVTNQIVELLKGTASIFNFQRKLPRETRQQMLSVLSFGFQLVRQYLLENCHDCGVTSTTSNSTGVVVATGAGAGASDAKTADAASELLFLNGDIYKPLLLKLTPDEKNSVFDHIAQMLGILVDNNYVEECTNKCWTDSTFKTVYEGFREGLEHCWNQQCQTQDVGNLLNIYVWLTVLAMKR